MESKINDFESILALEVGAIIELKTLILSSAKVTISKVKRFKGGEFKCWRNEDTFKIFVQKTSDEPKVISWTQIMRNMITGQVMQVGLKNDSEVRRVRATASQLRIDNIFIKVTSKKLNVTITREI